MFKYPQHIDDVRDTFELIQNKELGYELPNLVRGSLMPRLLHNTDWSVEAMRLGFYVPEFRCPANPNIYDRRTAKGGVPNPNKVAEFAFRQNLHDLDQPFIVRRHGYGYRKVQTHAEPHGVYLPSVSHATLPDYGPLQHAMRMLHITGLEPHV